MSLLQTPGHRVSSPPPLLIQGGTLSSATIFSGISAWDSRVCARYASSFPVGAAAGNPELPG